MGEIRFAIPPLRSCSANCNDVLPISSLHLYVDTDGSPQLKERISAEQSPNEHPVRLEQMSDLRKRPNDIPYPVQSPS